MKCAYSVNRGTDVLIFQKSSAAGSTRFARARAHLKCCAGGICESQGVLQRRVNCPTKCVGSSFMSTTHAVLETFTIRSVVDLLACRSVFDERFRGGRLGHGVVDCRCSNASVMILLPSMFSITTRWTCIKTATATESPGGYLCVISECGLSRVECSVQLVSP